MFGLLSDGNGGSRLDVSAGRPLLSPQIPLAKPVEDEGSGQEHVGGLEERAVRQIQHEIDDGEDERNNDHEPLAGAHLVLELTAPLDVGTGRQGYGARDDALRLLDEAADIPAP